MKLYNSFDVARQSVKNDKMMSAYMSEFVSFNVLDADYVEEKQKRLEAEKVSLQEASLQEASLQDVEVDVTEE